MATVWLNEAKIEVAGTADQVAVQITQALRGQEPVNVPASALISGSVRTHQVDGHLVIGERQAFFVAN